jgi:hypothetical protein
MNLNDNNDHHQHHHYTVVVVVVVAVILILSSHVIRPLTPLQTVYYWKACTHQKQSDSQYLLPEITPYEVRTSSIKKVFISVTAYMTNES